MKSKVIKDKYARCFSYVEKQFFLTITKQLSHQKVGSVFLKKSKGLTLLKNHCVFTNRSRSVFKFFKCSRIFLRAAGSSGMYSSFYKQSFLFCSYGETVDTADSKFVTRMSLQVQLLLRVYCVF